MNDINDSLYYAEVKLLTKYCHNCLDNKMKDKIMMFLFKKTLYENAIALDFTDMRTCNCTINDCKNCKDGYCELCK